MVKRCVTDTDNEGTPSTSQKRARTESEDSDDDHDDVEVTRTLSAIATKKHKPNGEQEDEEQDEEFQDQEDDKFEEEHGDQIREAIKSKQKFQGGIADHGIIESIEMHNFMCHKFLTFKFGPQINFIIGHNGSGKSAVLSAITVALGGKSNSTGRGSGLKSFIKEGEGVAEVTISLKNQGEEAYKSQDYGKSIVITRRFTKDGSSSWKIRSASGNIISTKRDELSAICDHMNIQVDNPMNVLTQDAARQFLSASAPGDKYKLFLRGTQLSQLSDEYETCLENIGQTAKILEQKKLLIPELQEKYNEAQARFNEAKRAREQKRKVEELRKELAWAHVTDKQQEMEGKMTESAQRSRRLQKIEEELSKANNELIEANADVEKYEAEVQGLGDMDHLNDEKRRIGDLLRANKDKIATFKRDEREMSNNLTQIKKAIEETDKRIAEETKRMEGSTTAKREETNRQLEIAKQAFDSAEKRRKDLQRELDAKTTAHQQLESEGRALEQQKQNAQRRINEANNMIEQCHKQQADGLAHYGHHIKSIIAKVNSMRWYGDKPLGPLGVHVKLKDQKWAPIMRSQLNQLMLSWAVSDARDRIPLKQLLDESGNRHASITIYERDLFDYSSGEPPAHILTVLRVLEFTDEYVKRIMINQARIERMVVAHTRRDAENQLRSIGHGSAWTLDNFRVLVYAEGGGSSSGLNRLPANSPANFLFQNKDIVGQSEHYQQQLSQAEDEYHRICRNFEEGKQRYNLARQEAEHLKRDFNAAWKDVANAKSRRDHLMEEVNNDMPVAISGLEASKQEAESERETILKQFEVVERQRKNVDEQQLPLMQDLGRVKANIADFEARREAAMTKVTDVTKCRLKAHTAKVHFQRKYDEEKAAVDNIESLVEVLQTEFKDWTSKAEIICKGERFENPRTAEVVKRQFESVQKALDNHERRQGATVEEMTLELNKRKAELDLVEKDLKNMTKLNKALKKSLLVRIHRWSEFRRHIALRCKVIFGYNLSHRGYIGKVLFNHDRQTLTLKVRTEDVITGTQGRDKDPRSLSGGEKSFSTICLLLSLWESIGCPLRCLDEFDVFMDAVNRRTSMKMMIDTANASDKKQYILITPQDMTNVNIGHTVRVHRMTDPERGQGVLAFN